MPVQGCRGSEDGQDLHENPVAGQILHHHQAETAGTHRELNDTGDQPRCPSSKWILLGHGLGSCQIWGTGPSRHSLSPPYT